MARKIPKQDHHQYGREDFGKTIKQVNTPPSKVEISNEMSEIAKRKNYRIDDDRAAKEETASADGSDQNNGSKPSAAQLDTQRKVLLHFMVQFETIQSKAESKSEKKETVEQRPNAVHDGLDIWRILGFVPIDYRSHKEENVGKHN